MSPPQLWPACGIIGGMTTPVTPSAPRPPGQVWAHVGQPFEEREFGTVIVGAGRMGAALALYLSELYLSEPHLSQQARGGAGRVLLVEQGGLPNEEGATILAPGVWSTLELPPEQHARAHWTRQQLAGALGDIQFQERPLVQLHATEGAGTRPTAEALADFPEALALLDPAALPFARVDAGAATYRPGSVALNAAQRAIRQGVNLLLNTRATPIPGGVRLERLTVTNTHQIVTHEVRKVRAERVVVAAGAAGPGLIEHSLGRHVRHAEAYAQYPRLNRPSAPGTPVLQVGPLRLRPAPGGWNLSLTPAHHDPPDYQPSGSKLTGVPTGLRRDLLETLVAHMHAVPALASEGLQLGQSLSDIPGAWVSLSPLPTWEDTGEGVYLLRGGLNADTLGLSTAHELTGVLAGAGP